MPNLDFTKTYLDEIGSYFILGRRFEESNQIEVLRDKLDVNLPEVGDSRNWTWPRFRLTLNDKLGVNLPKASDPSNQNWPRFYLTLNDKLGVNLPKLGDLRNQTWLRFYLTFNDKLGTLLIKTTTIELINTSNCI